MDEVEGYEGFGAEGNVFERRLVDVEMGDGRIRRGWVYVLAAKPTPAAPVPGNDWRAAHGRRAAFLANLAQKHAEGIAIEEIVARLTSRPWRQTPGRFAIQDEVDLAQALAEGVVSERGLAQATGRWCVV